MGCIIAATGIKTLCGNTCEVMDVIDFFAPKQNITCMECIVRQDAMFARGYEQKKYAIWYNSVGTWLSIDYDAYAKYGQPNGIPRKSRYTTAFMWTSKEIKGAIKLGKLGVHGMGLAK